MTRTFIVLITAALILSSCGRKPDIDRLNQLDDLQTTRPDNSFEVSPAPNPTDKKPVEKNQDRPFILDPLL